MKRPYLAWTVCLLSFCSEFGTGPPCRAAEIEDLGVAVRAVVFGNSQGCLAESPQGHPGMFYIPYYSTTGGALVGSRLGGTYIWACAASPDGMKIYAACYPTAGVLEYDLASRTLRDLGRMSPSEQYARSIAVDVLGKVWVGIGTHADLVVYDPQTEEHRSVLPQEYKHNSCAYDVYASGDHVFAELLYDHKHLIYDTRTEQPAAVLGQPPDGLSYMAARGGKEGCFYFHATLSGTLYRYRVGQPEPEKLAERLGQVAVVDGDRYAYAIDDQDFVLYDLTEQRALVRRKLAEARDGMALFSLAAAGDGKIYGSTYINMHMFSVDPQTGTIDDLGKALRWGGQIDSMHGGRDGKVYMGSYLHAVVSVYDPTRPWKIGTDRDSNPREIGPVGSGQYRTRSITLGPDGRVYVGSIPSYNSAPTGAFSRVDPESGEIRTWLDLVPGGAVDHVVADEHYLYGAGGGKLFVFDPEQAKVVLTLDLPVSALVLAPGGRIVGTGGGKLFVFSPSEMRVTHTADNPLADFTHMCPAPDGNLYGINPSRIGRIVAETWQVDEVAAEGGTFLAADQEGRLYFGRGSHVLRLSLKQ